MQSSHMQTVVEMQSADLVAELRAEVTYWWESVQKSQQQQRQQQQEQQEMSGSVLTPILGAMLGDGPVRMITLGHELTVDRDEKSLEEMQFKEMQVCVCMCVCVCVCVCEKEREILHYKFVSGVQDF